jgi:hypothetical protein
VDGYETRKRANGPDVDGSKTERTRRSTRKSIIPVSNTRDVPGNGSRGDVEGSGVKRPRDTKNIPVSNTRDALGDVEGSGTKRARESTRTSNVPVSNTRDARADANGADGDGDGVKGPRADVEGSEAERPRMPNTMTNILVSNTKDVLGDEWSRRRGEAMVVVRKREAIFGLVCLATRWLCSEPCLGRQVKVTCMERVTVWCKTRRVRNSRGSVKNVRVSARLLSYLITIIPIPACLFAHHFYYIIVA